MRLAVRWTWAWLLILMTSGKLLKFSEPTFPAPKGDHQRDLPQSLREHDTDYGMESIGHGARLSWARTLINCSYYCYFKGKIRWSIKEPRWSVVSNPLNLGPGFLPSMFHRGSIQWSLCFTLIVTTEVQRGLAVSLSLPFHHCPHRFPWSGGAPWCSLTLF